MSIKSAIDDIDKRIVQIRNAIAEHHAMELDLLNRPVTPKQAIAVLNDWVDRQAELFERETAFYAALYHGEAPDASRFSLSDLRGRDGLTSVLCRFFGDELKERIGEAVTNQIGNKGITDETRQKKLEEIRQKRRELEVEEESIIRNAESVGMTISRRGDADPAIVLADLTEEK